MVPDNIRNGLKPIFCCCVKEPDVKGMELVDDDRFRTYPEWVGTSILFWGKKKSTFPFQCFVGPDWPVVILTYFLIVVTHGLVFALIYKPLGPIPVLVGCISGALLLVFYTATIATEPGVIYKPMPAPAPLTVPAPPSGAVVQSEAVTSALLADSSAANVSAAETTGGAAGGDVESGHGGSGSGSGVSLLPAANTGGFQEVQGGISLSSIAPESAAKGTTSNPAAAAASSRPQQYPYSNNSASVPTTVECGQCSLQRPYSARHCYYCDVCVDELDHHCPWCGKCIGENNMKAFQAFVGLLNLQFYYLLGCALYTVMSPAL